MVDLRFNKEAVALRKNIKKRNQQKLMRNYSNDYDSTLSSLVISGGIPLNGKVTISGAKNAALPLLFASILGNSSTTLTNVPNLSDVHTTVAILKELGAKVEANKNKVIINSSSINCYYASANLVSSMRASVLMLGPLLAKFGSVQIATPGGCTIGKRPIDIHLRCLEQLGAKVEDKSSYIELTAKELIGTTIEVEKASVGATENLIMAAVLANGTTKIINPAKEPEIVDLALMLKSMGAKIKGEGTNVIEIEGVTKLEGTNYKVCPDRIEAGSYLMAAAITGGNLTLKNVNLDHISNIVSPLEEIGCQITKLSNSSLNIVAHKAFIAKDITTGTYPLFSTDLQPQWTTLMCLAKGSSTINETIFENRLGHTLELKKMGASIEPINKHIVKIHGVDNLNGATVFPADLRASFALIMAGLAAKGITTVYNLSFLDRGYENAIDKLKQCGANITRINSSSKSYITTNKLNPIPTS